MEGKGNSGKGNNVSRDDWETPKELFDLLNKQYKFTFDCCATKNNSKCFASTDNFIKMGVAGRSNWMNPPFSKAYEMFEHFFKVVKKGVAIYRCDNMETKVWQEQILKNCDWVFIPKGRVAYHYNPLLREGKGTRFPSALIGIGVAPPQFFKGVTLKPDY